MEGEVIFKDIRRYYCDICGICRSKKSLIRSHMLSEHKDDVNEVQKDEEEILESKRLKLACEECGACFRKPAHLKQHKQGHSLERSFTCHVDGCHSSYRRKDHLTRHLLKHENKLFECPVDNCNHKFTYQGNVKRHIEEHHGEDSPSCGRQNRLPHVCQEPECGKAFKYESKLRKHEESHVELDSVEVICCDPECMKHFTNIEALKDHLKSNHRYVPCEVCGSRQLKKNMKRHLRTHDNKVSIERIKCPVRGCCHIFTTISNLKKHEKAVHLELRPFTCREPHCGRKFPYKHVRDNHEKSHVYIHDDFVELDEQFRSRPRGGRKPLFSGIESLLRKRVAPPNRASSLDNASEYLRSLLSEDVSEFSDNTQSRGTAAVSGV
ncbi:transcription factor IIIA [Amborella trichopoda]|uniref:transcription factor IIIA n=1 Tax=Amborella trichopoda TaxID=13333 RepID=UPI0005D2EFF5|nr:transcription factor IIIA [Amborella trichopoda]|eukprot:XP_011628585.1 transcription factor IIIA [Amborella trichopoda]